MLRKGKGLVYCSWAGTGWNGSYALCGWRRAGRLTRQKSQQTKEREERSWRLKLWHSSTTAHPQHTTAPQSSSCWIAHQPELCSPFLRLLYFFPQSPSPTLTAHLLLTSFKLQLRCVPVYLLPTFGLFLQIACPCMVELRFLPLCHSHYCVCP